VLAALPVEVRVEPTPVSNATAVGIRHVQKRDLAGHRTIAGFLGSDRSSFAEGGQYFTPNGNNPAAGA